MNKRFLLLLFIFLALPVLGFAAESVDINTATLEQLDQITGIGPALGQRIIDARPFPSVDDLIKVSGIGEKTLQEIKEQGLACVNCQTKTDEPAKPEPPSIYPGRIFINEILPYPEGPDEQDEWIELYNSNNFEVDLSGWKIQDSAGAQKTYTIKNKIPAFGFLILKRPETKITLNNDQDALTLFSPDGTPVDSASCPKAPKNQSYNRTNSGWSWSLTLTPGAKNVITTLAPAKGGSASGGKSLSNYENSDKNDLAKTGLADLTQANTADKGANPWFLFFTALAITIVSASVVLFIKFRIHD